MNAFIDALTAAVLHPSVSAGLVLVWLVASVLARAAQNDRPDGPAPAGHARVARRALVAVSVGLTVATVQLLALVVAWSGLSPVPASGWPAVLAAVIGAGIVLAHAVSALRVLASGTAITDAARHRNLHSALAAAVVAGLVAVLAGALGVGSVPTAVSGGPYLAPLMAVAVVVLGTHAVLRRGLTPAIASRRG